MKINLLLAISIFGSSVAFAGQITNLKFNGGLTKNTLEINYSGNGHVKATKNDATNTIVIEGDGLDIPAKFTKAIEPGTSSKLVKQVTPFTSTKGGKNSSRILIRLKEPVEISSLEMKGKFLLDIQIKSDTKSAQIDFNGSSSWAKPQVKQQFIRDTWSESDSLSSKSGAVSESEDVAKKIVEVLNAPPEQKQYFGSRVTFESTNATVHDIFRLVGQASGLNIVTDSDVSGSSNYSVSDIPWDQLLDLVIQQAQLKAFVNGNVIRIVKLDVYNRMQEEKKKELIANDQFEPVVMAVIPLSFATADEMKRMIDSLLVKSQSSGTIANTSSSNSAVTDSKSLLQAFERGKIEIDSRSNSLVVTNTKGAIDRIKRLVKELDVPLPQVLIDAKIVVASESVAKSIGMAYGGKAQSGSGRSGAVLGGLGGAVGSIGANASTDSGFTMTTPKDGFGVGFQVGAGPNANLNATLQLSETNGTSKTIASPRVIVNNKVAASITDGQKIFKNTTATTNGVTTTTLNSVDASLSLNVTPQVTSTGSVLLKVSMSKSSVEPGGGDLTTNSKSLSTEVMVDSGNTLVLGGVYQFTDTKSEAGIPVLKDLPFIGQLFRTNSDSVKKDELMVFITPQIVDATDTMGGDSITGSSSAPKLR